MPIDMKVTMEIGLNKSPKKFVVKSSAFKLLNEVGELNRFIIIIYTTSRKMWATKNTMPVLSKSFLWRVSGLFSVGTIPNKKYRTKNTRKSAIDF